MSEENKKIEKIEKAEQSGQEVQPAELPEQELDKVAGGVTTTGFLKATSRIADTD